MHPKQAKHQPRRCKLSPQSYPLHEANGTGKSHRSTKRYCRKTELATPSEFQSITSSSFLSNALESMDKPECTESRRRRIPTWRPRIGCAISFRTLATHQPARWSMTAHKDSKVDSFSSLSFLRTPDARYRLDHVATRLAMKVSPPSIKVRCRELEQ